MLIVNSSLPQEVQKLQAKLREIDASRVDGKFVDVEGNVLEGVTKWQIS